MNVSFSPVSWPYIDVDPNWHVSSIVLQLNGIMFLCEIQISGMNVTPCVVYNIA
jgi:hypothetical protein